MQTSGHYCKPGEGLPMEAALHHSWEDVICGVQPPASIAIAHVS